MKEMGLDRCGVHGEKSYIYCTTCKRVVCPKCEDCRKHKIAFIDKLLEKYKDFITPGYMKRYGEEASELLRNIRSETGRYQRKLRHGEIDVEAKEEMVAKSGEKKEEDLMLIKKAIKYLRGVQSDASTNILKGRAQRAIDELDIEKEISEEFERYREELEELNKRLEDARRALEKLGEKENLLEKVMSEDEEERRLALALCLDRGLLVGMDDMLMEFRAMEGVEEVFDIDGVMEKRLVDVGEGVMISEPLVVEKGLRAEGGSFYTSLSHQGILAIYSWDKKNIVQFTNLGNGKQVEVEVEHTSNVAFYDDRMILLTWYKPLREARVEEVFKRRKVSVFKKIGDDDEVNPDTDTSLLHSRRILCYKSTQDMPYEYNVDTRENKRIEIEQKPYMFSSLMGIDCGVKAVFQDRGNRYTYALDWDNKVAPLHGVKEEGYLRSLFTSSTHPKDLSKSVLRHWSYLIKGGNKIDPREPICFESYQSVIRVYKDIFLLLDKNTKKWVLCRILVP